MSEDLKPLSDAEMIALAALANVDVAETLAANADRAARGLAMTYDSCGSDAVVRLQKELVRRGVL